MTEKFNPDKSKVEKLARECLADVQRITPKIVDEFKRSGNMYRYLATQIPVLIDEQIPPMVMANLREKGSAACFTGDYVAISTELTAEIIAEGLLYRAFVQGVDENRFAIYVDKEIRTILAHEFTHILCDHIGRQVAHSKKFKDVWSFTMACEIQANRGYNVDETSFVYGTGVTEKEYESAVPDIKSARTLESIYQAIKETLKDKVDEETQKSQSKENKGDKANENSEKEEGDGQPNKAPANQKANESQSSSNSSVQPNEANQGESQGSTGGQKSENHKGELSGRQKQLIQKMAEQMKKDKTPATSVQELLGLKPTENSKKGEMQEVPEYDNSDGDTSECVGSGSPFGMGGLGTSALGETPEEMLMALNEKMDKENIKKALARLRATIKGNVSKGRTKSYSRPPRRTVEGDLMKKGIKKDTRFSPSILVALDKSGSMDSTRVTQMATAVDNIVKQLGRDISNCYICLHDGQVQECQKLGNWKAVVQKYYASGGNQFSEVYRQAQKLGCDVVLNVGDGLDEITSNRGSHGKKQVFGGKQITWFDVIVSQLDDYSRHYWIARGIDEKHGVKRVPLDICGGLIPLEQCNKQNIEDYVAKNDEW